MKIIIYLIFLISYFHKILLYPLKLYLANNNSLNFNISIQDQPKSISLYYEGNFYSGNKILVEIGLYYTYRHCINIYGYINFTDIDNVNKNTYLIFLFDSIKIMNNEDCSFDISSYNYDTNYNKTYGIDCYFYCLKFTNCNYMDYGLLYAYIPFKCEDDVNDTYYLNIGEKKNISEIINFYFKNPSASYQIKFEVLPSSIGIFTYGNNFVSTENIYHSSNYLVFYGKDPGITTLSFKANSNFNHNYYTYTQTKTPCSMTLKICVVGCEKCEGYNYATFDNQYCFKCKDGYSFNETDSIKKYVNCFTDSTEIPGYYILNKKYEKCDKSCLRCKNQSKNCTECANSYYRKNGTSGEECYEKQPNEYLKDNILYSCHSNCESCSEEGDNNKNNCDKCKPDLHFYEDK